jgi:8-oxo-dGTP diphosphatase
MGSSQQLEPTAVVTAFLRHKGKVMLVQRSQRVGTYRGCWSAISGYLEDSTPLVQARREIREETGLPDSEIHLVASGEPLMIEAPELDRMWIVHPFLLDIDDPSKVKLDWENEQVRWVEPEALAEYPTVPQLQEALFACWELAL